MSTKRNFDIAHTLTVFGEEVILLVLVFLLLVFISAMTND